MEPLFDSHNHWQDERLDAVREEAIALVLREGLQRAVVNGSCEEDWPHVLALARRYPCVLPSFGVHPWYVRDLSPDWQTRLRDCLDRVPSVIGEIGLDRGIQNPDLPRQEEVFLWQWRLAQERNLPVTIHCLKAWGRLAELLRAHPAPERGFLLHSYGGSLEMVEFFAKMGGYFSISGYFAHERKSRQAETFRHVPRDRLLIETDAPDMWPPEPWNEHPIVDPVQGKPINHPANLGAVYRFVAGVLELSLEELGQRVRENFLRLFGRPGNP